MLALGCLLLIILPLVGLTAGGLIAGPVGARWGAALGFAVAIVLCGVASYALVKAGRSK